MRIYPDTPNDRGRAVARDALTLLTLFVLAWLALAAFGLLPIPGPLDEVALVVVGCLLWLFWRDSLREAWQHAGNSSFGDGAAGEA